MDLDPEVKDPFGIPVARIHLEWDENVLKMWEHSKESALKSCAPLEEWLRGQAKLRKFRAGAYMKPVPAAWEMIQRLL